MANLECGPGIKIPAADLIAAINDKLEGAEFTMENIKALYEANPDTNVFTDTERSKLISAGDMKKSIYDVANTGRVDDADKVNGLTVQTAVPVNAKFTDTTSHAEMTDKDTDGHPTGAIDYNETVVFNGLLDYGIVSANTEIDLSASQYQKITIDANILLTFINPPGPATVYLHIHQGISGGSAAIPIGEWSKGEIIGNNTTPETGHDLLMIHYTGSGYVFGMMKNLIVT